MLPRFIRRTTVRNKTTKREQTTRPQQIATAPYRLGAGASLPRHAVSRASQDSEFCLGGAVDAVGDGWGV